MYDWEFIFICKVEQSFFSLSLVQNHGPHLLKNFANFHENRETNRSSEKFQTLPYLHRKTITNYVTSIRSDQTASVPVASWSINPVLAWFTLFILLDFKLPYSHGQASAVLKFNRFQSLQQSSFLWFYLCSGHVFSTILWCSWSSWFCAQTNNS